MSLSDDDVARIARAVADELDDRKEARRVETAKSNRYITCIACGADTLLGGGKCWRCDEQPLEVRK